ncbi:MAG: serine/threonine protein kinase [Sandaracinaceae bacterium]|nr:serine/threonine protein kinase [Sandaracinaceae bacterium]
MSTSNHLRLVDEEGPTMAVDPLVGRVLDGRYLIESILGEGGMGLVYRAKHTALGKTLAVKVLRAEVSRDVEIVTRFRQEAQSATSIGNEHIIDISDFGALPDGSTYFVMEFLDGLSLTKVIEADRPIPSSRVVHIAKQLCHGLGAAHERGIVHRDLKPDNIYLVPRSNDKDFVKVLDFGIAKVGGATSKLTRAGQVFGTPHYMSPEQCAGTDVDHRTDIYAVGVILYEMTSGRVPFDADNLMGILTKHLYENPVPPRELAPPVNVSAPLEAVIMKCLAKKPDLRYQTMAEMRADLERIEAGTVTHAVTEAASRGPSTVRTDASSRAAQQMGYEDSEDVAQPRRSKGPMLGVVGGVVLIGALGIYFAFKPAAASPATNVSAALAVAPQAPASPPAQQAVLAQPAAAPGAPAVAIVTLASDPPGAAVYQGSELLGTTPVRIQRPTDATNIAVELRLAGYATQAFRISSLTNTEVNIPLPRARVAGPRRSGVNPGPAAPAAQAASPAPQTPVRPPARQSEVVDPWN